METSAEELKRKIKKKVRGELIKALILGFLLVPTFSLVLFYWNVRCINECK